MKVRGFPNFQKALTFTGSKDYRRGQQSIPFESFLSTAINIIQRFQYFSITRSKLKSSFLTSTSPEILKLGPVKNLRCGSDFTNGFFNPKTNGVYQHQRPNIFSVNFGQAHSLSFLSAPSATPFGNLKFEPWKIIFLISPLNLSIACVCAVFQGMVKCSYYTRWNPIIFFSFKRILNCASITLIFTRKVNKIWASEYIFSNYNKRMSKC